MSGFSLVLLCGALFFLYRALQAGANVSNTRRYHQEEKERIKKVIEIQPSNAGAHAQYGEFLADDGDIETAIHEYRTAISLLPMGPFTDKWKRQLKQLLEMQEIVASGRKIPGFNEWQICEKCQSKVSKRDRSCPKCGATLQMSFLEWVLNSQNQRDIWQQALPIALALWIGSVVFTQLPLEWKGTIIISSVLVGGWWIWRSID